MPDQTVTLETAVLSLGELDRYELAWTSSAAGSYSATMTATVIGTLLLVVFVPGTPAPTDDYDVTLKDEAGVDILAGQGANLDTAVPSAIVPGVPFVDGTTTGTAPRPLFDSLTLAVANAGNAKQGKLILYVRR